MIDKPIALIIYDHETTGQDPKTAVPVQVAAILKQPASVPFVVMNTLANPGCEIEQEASDVHGIFQKDVAREAPAEVVMFMLGNYVEWVAEDYHVIICGQNHLAYDNPISERMGWDVTQYPQIDTLILARRLYPRMMNHKLETLYEMITGTSLSGAHDALVDIEAVDKVIEHMLPEFEGCYHKMAEACTTPQAWEIMPISKKHKGKRINDVPMSFWKWMIKNTSIMDDNIDFRETIKVHFPFLYEAHTGENS